MDFKGVYHAHLLIFLSDFKEIVCGRNLMMKKDYKFSRWTLKFHDVTWNEHNLILVNPNDMGPKALVRGLQDLSKMSKNMFIWSKLSKICIGEVGKVLWICKSQLCSKHFVFANGPQISSWDFIQGLCTTHWY